VVRDQLSGTNPWSISAWVNLGSTDASNILYRRDAAFDASARYVFTSLLVAWRAVSPARRFLPASRNSFDQL
jgi:hypothetical protein